MLNKAWIADWPINEWFCSGAYSNAVMEYSERIAVEGFLLMFILIQIILLMPFNTMSVQWPMTNAREGGIVWITVSFRLYLQPEPDSNVIGLSF